MYDLTHFSLGWTSCVFAASLFPFGKRKTNPVLDASLLDDITRTTIEFLKNRGIEKFDVFSAAHEGRSIVHIQAEAHKNLRFSNLIELQIRQHIEKKTGHDIGAVFWRFQLDKSDQPSVEQVHYDEFPKYPQDHLKAAPAPEGETPPVKQPAATPEEPAAPYDLHTAAREGIEVEEISLQDFEAILQKTAPPGDKPK
ncbi:MAG TPA: hypothetical protein DEP05_04240 [Betaproteobacteria bacterium]|nr:hypothetical protein [Betaproteobacteria bacterium]